MAVLLVKVGRFLFVISLFTIFVKNHISMRNKIFAILYYSSLLNRVQFLGTGFVVSKSGRFVTAGHTFGKLKHVLLDKNKFRAVFVDENNSKKQIVSFLTICYKYLPIDKQTPPILYDIAYGSLEEGMYEHFKIDENLLSVGDILSAPHYKSDYRCIGKSFGENLNISSLNYFEPSMSMLLNTNASIYDKKYSNCMDLIQKTKIAHGASGCPLVNAKGCVSGLFIAASEVDDKRYALNASSINELSKD